MEKILKRLKDLVYEIDNDRETINGISNELYEIIQALQLLQTDVIKSVCKHCNNKLCDSQTFNQQCFKCGKKPL